jgi:hypothetical protein
LKIRFRWIWMGLLVLTGLLLLGVPVAAGVSTGVDYAGKCYGFTDGAWDCTAWEYARNEMFWMSVIVLPFFLLLLAAWLLTLGVWFLRRRSVERDRLPLWLALAIPALAFPGGLGLLYLLSLVSDGLLTISTR